MANSTATDPLVSTEWLAARIGQPDLVVFDCSFYLPTEKRDADAEYESAHIPSARRFNIDRFADTDGDLPHMVPSPARFTKLMREEGVSNNSTVVFYDGKGLFSAGRGWWLMGLFGHDAAFVLDGGFPKWQREGRPVESGQAHPVQPGDFNADFRAARLRGVGDIRANLITGAELILDARSAGRFDASQPEPRPGLRGGHIPGSHNLPFNTLIREDGTMLDAAALRDRFAAAGVDGTRPVVTSCGTGVSAAMLSLGLRRAGLPQGALYDGSWTEWAGRTDLPVER